MDRPLFFSIIVPAHNEENYLEATLAALAALDYPTESFEVIVVENGSTDRTLEVAKKFEETHGGALRAPQLKICSFEDRGVAFARNRGIEVASPNADWLLFLDADTVVTPSCLSELQTFFRAHESRCYTLGTTSIKPLTSKLISRFYFFCCDVGHIWTKTAYGAFLVVRRDILEQHRFDEALSITEDGEISHAANEKGRFFFLQTNSVRTSTRRFDKGGWLRTLVFTAIIGLLPLHLRRRFVYEVIR